MPDSPHIVFHVIEVVILEKMHLSNAIVLIARSLAATT